MAAVVGSSNMTIVLDHRLLPAKVGSPAHQSTNKGKEKGKGKKKNDEKTQPPSLLPPLPYSSMASPEAGSYSSFTSSLSPGVLVFAKARTTNDALMVLSS